MIGVAIAAKPQRRVAGGGARAGSDGVACLVRGTRAVVNRIAGGGRVSLYQLLLAPPPPELPPLDEDLLADELLLDELWSESLAMLNVSVSL